MHLSKEEEKVWRGREDVRSAGGFVVFEGQFLYGLKTDTKKTQQISSSSRLVLVLKLLGELTCKIRYQN